ncbi:MAG TPA: hypothetical protein O0X66_05255 [Methanocorpusculum sp.]|nr:hypothetical protein [Methanocorpusculum sp.]
MPSDDDICILRELIKQNMIVEPFINADSGKYDLRLIDQQNPHSKVRITDVPRNTLAIKSDYFDEANKFFNSTKGECKRSDYIIISTNNADKWAIFVELKQSTAHSKQKDIINQLRGTRCFYEYCRYTIRQFWSDIAPVLDEYNERYVVFPNTNGSRKRPVVYDVNGPIHNNPKEARKIYRNDIDFNILVIHKKNKSFILN